MLYRTIIYWRRDVLADLNDELINSVREQNPNNLAAVERAARTISFNRICYNRIHRVNKEGKFNVTFGKRENPTIYEPEILLVAHKSLQGVQLIHGECQQMLKRYARPGDFIYIDPRIIRWGVRRLQTLHKSGLYEKI